VVKKTEGPVKQESLIGPVYELRVRKPREIRVYFQFVNNTYFLLDIGDKTHQDIDIKNAFSKAKSLRSKI
jgi:putative component of toxin-antitoxin plasmid stabilization module